MASDVGCRDDECIEEVEAELAQASVQIDMGREATGGKLIHYVHVVDDRQFAWARRGWELVSF